MDVFCPFDAGAWTNSLKTLPLASQETCAAMEFYHRQLKIRLSNEKDSSVYQRADWLVDKLGTKVHSYFWLDEYSGKDDFARYWKNEWMSGLTSWRKALKIPETDVLMEDGSAKVTDQHDRDKAYVVWNPGSILSICNCSWAQDGYLCEHVLKVTSICRKRGSILPSISLFQYQRALNNMLHCPPYDSLNRDHAMSLAVSVQQQLNTLLDKESVETVVDPNEKRIIIDIPQETSRVVSANQDQDLVRERHVIAEVSYRDSDGCEDGSEAPGCAMGDIADQVVDHDISRSHIQFESAGEDTLPADMDVDPSSICISPPGLYSVDETVSYNAFRVSKESAFTAIGNEISASKNDALFDDKIEEVISDKGCKDDVMDVDPPDVDIASSTTETPKHCETHQDGVDGVPVVCSKDADSHLSNSPPLITTPVEPPVAVEQALDTGENSGIIKKDVNFGSYTGN